MKFKEFIKEFWRDNKTAYIISCVCLTFAVLIIYDLIFISSIKGVVPSVQDHLIWLPVSYSLMGIMGLSLSIFTGGKKINGGN